MSHTRCLSLQEYLLAGLITRFPIGSFQRPSRGIGTKDAEGKKAEKPKAEADKPAK
jgi:hypothetical protein